MDSRCGDGVVEGDEQCDDGNRENNDECRNNCTLPEGVSPSQQVYFYSDGSINLYPNLADQSLLTEVTGGKVYYVKTDQDLLFKCDEEVSCGDGVCTDSENTLICPPGQPCRKLCEQDCVDDERPRYCLPCGDTCTEWTLGDPNPVCGDRNSAVQCDFIEEVCIRTDSPDAECGNSVIEDGETCDDGNRLNNDGCTRLCIIEECGDGIKQQIEECDDGNLEEDDNCLNDCTRSAQPSCGDGIIDTDAGEECDDSNYNNNDGCNSTCQEETCGDGIQQTSEA
ncbi:hypothetical protein COU76_01615, partial [Candidatus Peregrinibacteria bacterium CG10_big_fil_rev_8_21_14_0_10_49_10]